MSKSADVLEMREPWPRDFLERYLLGETSPEERERFEVCEMPEDGALESLLCAESELIDAYVSGALAPSARQRFETHFLVTERRRQRLAFARTLKARQVPAATVSAAALSPRRRSRFLPLALRYAAALLVVGVGAWIGYERFHLSSAPRRVVARYEITQGQTRSAARVDGFVLPGEDGWIDVQLTLPTGAQFSTYRVRLEDTTGRVLWSSEPITPSRGPAGNGIVTARVPRERLAAGSYALFLSGLTADGGVETFEEYRLVLRAP